MRREHNLIPEDGELNKKLFRIIYFADTPLGKLFDVVLLLLIALSTMIVVLDSVEDIDYHNVLWYLEGVMTFLFATEYVVRIKIIKNKKDYILSFLGLIDLIAILPFFIGLFAPEVKYLLIIRLLRMLRIFRVMNMMDYMDDSYYIIEALKQSSRKIYIFLLFIIIIVVILGSLMYIIEGGINGFENIPKSIYWAVVTITTVGYGDISPVTPLGKFISVILMLCGYSIIAVPTGIVTSQMRPRLDKGKKICNRCGNIDNDDDARYCKECGEKIVEEEGK
ncbi:MAG: ion transporter [Flavobacteriaceae bacterium]|nr:ion transporter [Flavobacteriaceae bacterium]